MDAEIKVPSAENPELPKVSRMLGAGRAANLLSFKGVSSPLLDVLGATIMSQNSIQVDFPIQKIVLHSSLISSGS